MPPRRTVRRRIVLGCVLVIGLVIMAVVALIVLLIWQNTGDRPAAPFELTRLHRSTFTHFQDSSDETVMMFGDGTHGLVSDNLWQNECLYRIDIATATVAQLDLPGSGPHTLTTLIYGGDAVYALYHRADVTDIVAYKMTRARGIQRLAYVDHTTTMIGTEPREAARVRQLLAAGELQNLRRMEKEICVWDPHRKIFVRRKTSRIEYFANERWLVQNNVESIGLTSRSTRSVVDSCDRRMVTPHPRYRLELDRTPASGTVESALDLRISAARIFSDKRLVHAYTFELSEDMYYSATWVGDRLFFVGTSVAYVDMRRAF
jgi:hypothetical protein